MIYRIWIDRATIMRNKSCAPADRKPPYRVQINLEVIEAWHVWTTGLSEFKYDADQTVIPGVSAWIETRERIGCSEHPLCVERPRQDVRGEQIDVV